MGGEIGVKSEPGVGSTFWCTVRFDPPSEPPADQPAPRETLRGLRALVVDDNAANRSILEGHLRGWGVAVETACDGHDGLAAFRRSVAEGRPFDVGILDFQMPGMDGIELGRAVTEAGMASKPRLVLLTSSGRRGDGNAARQAGIDAYLTKPVRLTALHDALTAVTALEAGQRSARLVTEHSIAERRASSRSRILLVEDNPVNQRVGARLLESLGHRVDVAANGREAVEAVTRAPYAAVLMDCQMPEMDGFEAARVIRSLEGDSRTPIIAMTAGAMETDREKCLAAGMDDYVSKPVSKERLAAILDAWIKPKVPARETEAHMSDDSVKPANGAAPLDGRILEGLRELEEDADEAVVADLVETYLGEATKALEELAAAVRLEDFEHAAAVAHRLKGSSGAVAAVWVADACANVERAAASRDASRTRAALDVLDAEFARARPALEAEGARPFKQG